MRAEFFLPGVFAENIFPRAVNGSIWSLFYEVRAYLVVLILGVVGLLRLRWTALLGWIVASALIWIWPQSWGISTANDAPVINAYLCFVGGALVAIFPTALRYLGWPALALAVAMPLSFGHAWVEYHTDALLCSFFLWAAHEPLPLIRNFGRHGDFSYGIFLYAFPTQQLIAWGLHTEHHPYLMMVYAFPATLLLAWVSWNLIEAPSLAMKRPWGDALQRRLVNARASVALR